MIESTHGGAAADAQLTAEAKLVLAAQAQAEADRPTRNELDTVNFQRLDTENDWTDV